MFILLSNPIWIYMFRICFLDSLTDCSMWVFLICIGKFIRIGINCMGLFFTFIIPILILVVFFSLVLIGTIRLWL